MSLLRMIGHIYTVKIDYSIDNVPRWIVYKNNKWVEAFQTEQQANNYIKGLIT